MEEEDDLFDIPLDKIQPEYDIYQHKGISKPTKPNYKKLQTEEVKLGKQEEEEDEFEMTIRELEAETTTGHSSPSSVPSLSQK